MHGAVAHRHPASPRRAAAGCATSSARRGPRSRSGPSRASRRRTDTALRCRPRAPRATALVATTRARIRRLHRVDDGRRHAPRLAQGEAERQARHAARPGRRSFATKGHVDHVEIRECVERTERRADGNSDAKALTELRYGRSLDREEIHRQARSACQTRECMRGEPAQTKVERCGRDEKPRRRRIVFGRNRKTRTFDVVELNARFEADALCTKPGGESVRPRVLDRRRVLAARGRRRLVQKVVNRALHRGHCVIAGGQRRCTSGREA